MATTQQTTGFAEALAKLEELKVRAEELGDERQLKLQEVAKEYDRRMEEVAEEIRECSGSLAQSFTSNGHTESAVPRRGRPPKAKRGRPPKNATQEAPKRRGRPPKNATQEAPKAKRRPKNATQEAPKRRGRPPKNAAQEAPKRGRPPKNAAGGEMSCRSAIWNVLHRPSQEWRKQLSDLPPEADKLGLTVGEIKKIIHKEKLWGTDSKSEDQQIQNNMRALKERGKVERDEETRRFHVVKGATLDDAQE